MSLQKEYSKLLSKIAKLEAQAQRIKLASDFRTEEDRKSYERFKAKEDYINSKVKKEDFSEVEEWLSSSDSDLRAAAFYNVPKEIVLDLVDLKDLVTDPNPDIRRAAAENFFKEIGADSELMEIVLDEEGYGMLRALGSKDFAFDILGPYKDHPEVRKELESFRNPPEGFWD